MPCHHFKLDDGTTAIVYSRVARKGKRCRWCTAPHTLLCDWKLGGGKTCDKPICGNHAQEVGADKHLCPDHQAAYAIWKAKRKVVA